jgi:hypothetical protein
VAALAVVLRLATDKDPDVVGLTFNALMAASAGILGGLLAGAGPSAGDDRQ